MALSNTAVPKYYGMFRDAVIRGEIPVNKEISMEMNRIDDLIANPGVYYDDRAVEGFIDYCESELTLTDGADLNLLDTFKLWAEQIFGWYYFVERSVYEPYEDGYGGHYITKKVRKRLINKQYLIVARGAAKSMYGSCLQNFFLNVDATTTHQITTAPTMKQAEEVLSPIRTSITRARGPYFKFLTEGSLQNTTGSKANRVKLSPTKKGIENFLTGSLLEIRPMRIDKLQGLQIKVATVDEWLSGDIREDVIGAIEQGASKVDDYLIVAISSEGTVRNGAGDTIKMELMDILKGDYINPHVSIWWYKLDSIDEVSDPAMWVKAQPTDVLSSIIVRNTEFYDAARDMVAGFANGISANTFLAEAKAAEMAAAAARAARRELDEHSPSKVGYEIGDFFGVAFVGAIGDYADKSYRAGAEMGSKARIGLTEAVSKISDYINSDIDAQPTIRPVLDLSNVQSGTRQINAMFSRTQAMSINANMSRAHTSGNQNGGFQDGSAATYNYFTQNNYSPKALSRVEIYRQTKNQFSAMKGTVSKR